MRKSYKTNDAYQKILSRIQAGIYSCNSFLEPEVDLAYQLAVSRITLRRALDILISEGLIIKMPNKGYTVSKKVLELKKADKVILFILSYHDIEEVYDGFHSIIWRGIQKIARENGYLPMIYPYDAETVLYSRVEFFKNMATGIVSDIVNVQKLDALKKFEMPLIVVDYVGEPNGFDVVVQDNYGAMTCAVKKLKERGAQKIGYVNAFIIGEDTDRNLHAEQRLEGFYSGVHKEGFNPSNVFVVDGKLEKEPYEQCLLQLFSKGVDAIVFPFGKVLSLISPEIWSKSPQRLKIVSWGKFRPKNENIIYFGSLTWNPAIMGQEAAQRIVQRINNPQLDHIRIIVPIQYTDSCSSELI